MLDANDMEAWLYCTRTAFRHLCVASFLYADSLVGEPVSTNKEANMPARCVTWTHTGTPLFNTWHVKFVDGRSQLARHHHEVSLGTRMGVATL